MLALNIADRIFIDNEDIPGTDRDSAIMETA